MHIVAYALYIYNKVMKPKYLLIHFLWGSKETNNVLGWCVDNKLSVFYFDKKWVEIIRILNNVAIATIVTIGGETPRRCFRSHTRKK